MSRFTSPTSPTSSTGPTDLTGSTGLKLKKPNLFLTLVLAAAVIAAAIMTMSCSTMSVSQQKDEIKIRLSRAEYFFNHNDYQQAAQEYEQLLAQYPRNPWQDKVLFSLGRLYGRTDNPQRDFKTSLSYFQKLKTGFPKSSYIKETEEWLNWLAEIISLQEKINSLQTEISTLQAELNKVTAEKIEAETALSAGTLRQAQERAELENKIRQQNALIENLKNQLEKIKEIDVLTERKTKKDK
jgi:tetratricopeptide (TPR) repeat protein